MYRIEFTKEHLEAQDTTIGEVFVRNGVDGSRAVRGIIYQAGTEFSTQEEAEAVAEEFEELFKPFPEVYKVTTEVYEVKETEV